MNSKILPWGTGILLLAAVSALSAQAVDQKLSAAVQRVFGANARSEASTIRLSPDEITKITSLCGLASPADVRYQTVLIGSRIAGYAMVDNARGKSQPITYVLMVDPTISVMDLEILVYREPYGGEVSNESFRRQFRGKRSRDNVRIGSGIRNISGATISSNAVTNGTRRLLATLQVLKEGGRLR